MTQEVELPDGTVLEFPVGTAPDVMRSAIAKRFPQYAKPVPNSMPFRASEEAMRSEPAPKPTPYDFTDRMVDAFTMNLSDEAAGAAKAVPELIRQLANTKIGRAFSPGSTEEQAARYAADYANPNNVAANRVGEAYQSGIAERKEARQAYGDENPVTSTAMNVLGTVASGGLTKAGPIAQTLKGKVGQGLSLGAQYGALQGAGDSAGESLEDRAKSIVGGALGGAAVGGLLPAVGAGIKTAYNATLGPVLQRVFSSTDNQASREVIKAISRDLKLPPGADVQAEVAKRMQALGPEAVLADLGENSRGLLRALASTPGETRNAATAVLGADATAAAPGRQAKQVSQVLGVLDDAFGGVGQFGFQLEGLAQRRALAAKPLYEEAYKLPVQASAEMAEMLSRPAGKDALRKAVSIAANEGETAAANMLRELAKRGGIQPGKMYNTKIMDYVARGLDDVIAGQKDATTGKIVSDVGRSVVKLRQAYVDQLMQANPTLAQARTAYAAPSRVMEAMEAGRKAPLNDLTAFRQAADRVTEQDAFRAGAVEQLRKRIANARDGGDALTRLAMSSEERAILKELLPNQSAFDRFTQALNPLKEQRKTFEALRGSRTEPLRQEIGDLGAASDAVEMARAATGSPGAFLSALNRLRSRLTLSEAARNAAGQTMLSRDPAPVQAQIQNALRRGARDEALARLMLPSQARAGAEAGDYLLSP